MMIWGVMLAAISVTFPRPGQHLPSLTQCYAIGYTDGGESTITIQGESVPVAEGGGWVTMLKLQSGENKIYFGKECLTVKVDPPPSMLKRLADKSPKVYTKLEYAADEPKVPPKGQPASKVVITLDAGHGGEDTGTLSPHATPEKTLNLLMVQAVAAKLRTRGYQVVLTRDRDVAVPLYDRPKVAHAAKADAFISIHHNAPPYDKDPRQLRYHTVYAWNEIGRALALPINRRMAAALGDSLKNNGVMTANYAVTRNPEIPSCLIEVDFMTTPEGEEDCWNSERRQTVAAAIAAGIEDWLK